ncbi:acetyl-CoA carboxylase biotin carboxyl carrier protein subunit, partial [Dermatophilus congolensis]
HSIVVEIEGKRIEVTLPDNLTPTNTTNTPKKKTSNRRTNSRNNTTNTSGDALTAPMQGTVVKVAVSNGDTVAEGDLIFVLEAMKMEQPLTAHKSGTITGLSINVGDTVTSGTVLTEIKTP